MNNEELQQMVIDEYNNLLQHESDRTISWGELAYIQSLNKKELNELYNEIITSYIKN